MLEIIYVSAAVTPFSDEQLVTLLTRARARNDRLGVTGMLLYDRGSFLQVMEGESSVVKALFETVAKDPRHRRVLQISETPITTRCFDGWSMGFVSLDRHRREQPRGYSDLLAPSFSVDTFLVSPSYRKARDVLLAFRDGRFRSHVGA